MALVAYHNERVHYSASALNILTEAAHGSHECVHYSIHHIGDNNIIR